MKKLIPTTFTKPATEQLENHVDMMSETGEKLIEKVIETQEKKQDKKQ